MRGNWQAALDGSDIRQARKPIAAGADIKRLDHHGQKALLRRVHAGRLPLIPVLLVHGAELDRTAKYGMSALKLVIVAGHDAIAPLLIDVGASCHRILSRLRDVSQSA